MALTEIEYGGIASSKVLNDNFEYLDDRINTTSQGIASLNATMVSLVNTQVTTLKTNVNDNINKITSSVYKIGQPIMRLDDTLYDDEIRLEGAEVSREAYSTLFAIFGETYGAGNGITTFNLPNFTGRVMWGATDYGYIEAGLPNITGSFNSGRINEISVVKGAFYVSAQNTGFTSGGGSYGYYCSFDASRSSSVYGKSTTVQPPAIKVRWVTRYK